MVLQWLVGGRLGKPVILPTAASFRYRQDSGTGA